MSTPYQPPRRSSRIHVYLLVLFASLAGPSSAAFCSQSEDLYVHVRWSIFHEGCRVFRQTAPGLQPSDEILPLSTVRGCLLEKQVDNAQAQRSIGSASEAELAASVARAAAAIPREFDLLVHLRWVAIHEGSLPLFRKDRQNGDYEAIRFVYRTKQDHNPNTRNLLAAISDAELDRLLDTIEQETADIRIPLYVSDSQTASAILRLDRFLPREQLALASTPIDMLEHRLELLIRERYAVDLLSSPLTFSALYTAIRRNSQITVQAGRAEGVLALLAIPRRGGRPATLTLSGLPTAGLSSDVIPEDATVDQQMLVFLDGDCDELPIRQPVTVLDASEAAFLKKMLASPPPRRTTVFVLDDGWPDLTTARESYSYLEGRLQALRRHLKLDPRSVRSYDSLSVSPAPHAQYIQAALREFQNLDRHRAVRLIYLPLYRVDGSDGLLEELLFLHETILSLWQRRLLPGRDKPSGTVEEEARNAAREALRKIARTREGPRIASSAKVLDALLTLADTSTDGKETPPDPFFINCSWTLSNHLLNPFIPPAPVGLIVAAAGNSGIDVNGKPPIDLAWRGTCCDDTLTVITMDERKAPDCGSSVVSAEPEILRDVRAAGYMGNVTPACCRSSFATPRVAWILGALDAYRASEVGRASWRKSVLRRLFVSQKRTAGLSGLRLRLAAFEAPERERKEAVK